MRQERRQPENPFDFTERERLYDRVSHERLLAIIEDEQTTVHDLMVSTNRFGEFQFITVSGPTGSSTTFYGSGYHDYRERWITGEWYWYEAAGKQESVIEKQEAVRLLRERQAEIAGYATDEPQTGRGRLFELLADSTDEDAALTELEDMGNWLDE